MSNDAVRSLPGPPVIDREYALSTRDLKMGYTSRFFDMLSQRPRNLRSFGEEAHTLLGCALVLEPDGPEPAHWLRILARSYTLAAARLIPGDGPVTLELPPYGHVAVPRVDQSEPLFTYRAGALSPYQYVEACHAALALGDEDALALLGAIPADRLTALEGPWQHHILLQARILRHLARGETGLAASLVVEAVVACNSSALTGLELDFAQMITSPALELATFWGRPTPDWEQRLTLALGLHRLNQMLQWPPGHPASVSDLVALGPLAFAALRHAAGLPGGVTAPELPPALVQRRYGDPRWRHPIPA